MSELRLILGHIAGRQGILVCVVAVVARLFGYYSLFNFSTAALLQVGMAGLLVGCFELLLVRGRSD